MRKYQPEGSLTFFERTSSKNISLASGQVKPSGMKLRGAPDDLDTRLLLLGKSFQKKTSAFFSNLIWLIDNHPRHCIHQIITVHEMNDAYKEARRRWVRQIRLNKNDVTVLYHAAVFFSLLAPKYSVKLLQKAIDLDPGDDELPRQLSNVYSLMVGPYSFLKNQSLAHEAAKQMKIAITCYANPTFEESYLLPYFSFALKNVAELALQFELFDDANDLAQLLLSHCTINVKRLALSAPNPSNPSYSLSTNFGYAILGKIALAAGKESEASAYLLRMMDVPILQNSDWVLANELLQRGKSVPVIKYIEHALSGRSSKGAGAVEDVSAQVCLNLERATQLQNWLRQIDKNQKPRLC